MKVISSIFEIIVFTAISSTSFAAPLLGEHSGIQWKRFADIYSEETGLSQAKTVATYTQVRAGWGNSSNLETYAALRVGADSRTMVGNSASIYNDNYAFLGLGIDFTGLLPGVRLTAQAGASLDLSPKLKKGGFDLRTGIVGYHEIQLGRSPGHIEFYTDCLYIRRYDNLLTSSQIRLLYPIAKVPLFKFDSKANDNFITVSPMFNFASSMDSAGLDFNRFFEARFGFRIATTTPISIMLSPYYAYGVRWQRPTEHPTYSDLRILLAFYATI